VQWVDLVWNGNPSLIKIIWCYFTIQHTVEWGRMLIPHEDNWSYYPFNILFRLSVWRNTTNAIFFLVGQRPGWTEHALQTSKKLSWLGWLATLLGGHGFINTALLRMLHLPRLPPSTKHQRWLQTARQQVTKDACGQIPLRRFRACAHQWVVCDHILRCACLIFWVVFQIYSIEHKGLLESLRDS